MCDLQSSKLLGNRSAHYSRNTYFFNSPYLPFSSLLREYNLHLLQIPLLFRYLREIFQHLLREKEPCWSHAERGSPGHLSELLCKGEGRTRARPPTAALLCLPAALSYTTEVQMAARVTNQMLWHWLLSKQPTQHAHLERLKIQGWLQKVKAEINTSTNFKAS